MMLEFGCDFQCILFWPCLRVSHNVETPANSMIMQPVPFYMAMGWAQD